MRFTMFYSYNSILHSTARIMDGDSGTFRIQAPSEEEMWSRLEDPSHRVWSKLPSSRSAKISLTGWSKEDEKGAEFCKTVQLWKTWSTQSRSHSVMLILKSPLDVRWKEFYYSAGRTSFPKIYGPECRTTWYKPT